MSPEELKKLCKEEFLKNIKENIKSETIFTYVDGLEKENKKLHKELDYADNYNIYLIAKLDKIKEYCELNKEFTPRLEDILDLLEE